MSVQLCDFFWRIDSNIHEIFCSHTCAPVTVRNHFEGDDEENEEQLYVNQEQAHSMRRQEEQTRGMEGRKEEDESDENHDYEEEENNGHDYVEIEEIYVIVEDNAGEEVNVYGEHEDMYQNF